MSASSSLHWRLRVSMVWARQKLQFGLAIGFALGCLFSALASAVFPEQRSDHLGLESNHYLDLATGNDDLFPE